MKIKKLKIKSEYLKEDKTLEVLSYMLNRKNDVYLTRRMVNFGLYIDSAFEKDAFYKEVEQEFESLGQQTIKNLDIHTIIRQSKYSPFSFHFTKHFFSEVFHDCKLFDQYKFKREKGRTASWIYRNILVSFLEKFTNIEDVVNDFMDQVLKHNFYIAQCYGDSQYSLLIYFYIKRDKKRYSILKKEGIDIKTIDNKFTFIQRGDKIKSLTYTRLLYYLSHFQEGSHLFD